MARAQLNIIAHQRQRFLLAAVAGLIMSVSEQDALIVLK